MKVFITGASRGIGLALCQHFLDQGHQVAGLSRGKSDLSHPSYRHFEGDVCSEADVKRVMRELRKDWKVVDVLINNAGIARMIPFALTPPSSARDVMDVSYHGTFTVSHAAIRLLRKSENPRIINFTSVAVPLRLEGEISYAAAKAAVESFTRIAAKELADFGITCNAIGPSPIETDLIRSVPKDKIRALLERQAIHKMGSFSDVSNVIDFFVRPESRMITGQIIYLGGVG
ncbi:MAG: oxidoreductase [Blastopirellula sp.]|nr:MAG: oxidoreductase [Blastopirellula sp.]